MSQKPPDGDRRSPAPEATDRGVRDVGGWLPKPALRKRNLIAAVITASALVPTSYAAADSEPVGNAASAEQRVAGPVVRTANSSTATAPPVIVAGEAEDFDAVEEVRKLKRAEELREERKRKAAEKAKKAKAAKKKAAKEAKAKRAAQKSKAGFVKPAEGRLTSNFGARWGTTHSGIDIANSIGTPIVSVAEGTVVEAGPASGFGLWVKVRHGDGTVTVYGHMDQITTSVGARVGAGDKIATIGNRGQSTGPHLHFEVHQGGSNKIDPLPWLASRGVSL